MRKKIYIKQLDVLNLKYEFLLLLSNKDYKKKKKKIDETKLNI